MAMARLTALHLDSMQFMENKPRLTFSSQSFSPQSCFLVLQSCSNGCRDLSEPIPSNPCEEVILIRSSGRSGSNRHILHCILCNYLEYDVEIGTRGYMSAQAPKRV